MMSKEKLFPWNTFVSCKQLKNVGKKLQQQPARPEVALEQKKTFFLCLHFVAAAAAALATVVCKRLV